MGKIFEYFGFIFYFFSNEHDPIHVHVKHGSEECIFDIILEDAKLVRIERREKQGAEPLNPKDAAEAIKFIDEYWLQIVEKWVAFHVYHQAVKNTKINKRIRNKEDNETD